MLLAQPVAAQQLKQKDIDKYNALHTKVQGYRQANWPPAPSPEYRPYTLGRYLNEEFKSHADNCGFGRNNPAGNYIPGNFLKREELNRRVIKIGLGGELLMTYLFTTTEVNNITKTTQVTGNRIIDLNNQRILISPSDGIASAYIYQSCSGYYNAKVTAQSSLSVPLVALQAAVSAENDRARQGSMAVVKGDFSSPLNSLLNSTEPSGVSANAFLWNFYRHNPTQNNKLFYLSNFQGVHVRRFNATKDKALYQGNLKFGLNSFVNLTADNSGNTELKNLFSAKDWVTLITTDLSTPEKRKAHFRQVKGVNEVIAYFKQLQPKGEIASETPVMVMRRTNKVTFMVEGLPREMSANGYWQLAKWDKDIYASKPDVRSTYLPAKKACLITVEGMPRDSLFTQLKTSVHPEFVFVGRRESSLQNKYITLSARIDIPTSVNPTLSFEDFARPFKRIGDGDSDRQILTWQVEVRVNDEGNPLDYDVENVSVKKQVGNIISRNTFNNVIDLDNFSIACRLKSKQDKMYEIDIKTYSDFGEGFFDFELNQLKYKMTLVLELPLAGGNGTTTPKPIDVIINYPRQKIGSIETDIESNTDQNTPNNSPDHK